MAAFAKQQGLTEEEVFAQLELKYPQAKGQGGVGVTPGAQAKRAAAMANPAAASNRMGRSPSSSERRRRDRASKFGGGGGGVQDPASKSHERASKFSSGGGGGEGGGLGRGLAPPTGAYPPPPPVAQEQDQDTVRLVSAKKKDRARQRWKKAGGLTKVAVRFKSSAKGLNGKDLLAKVFGGASTGGELAGGAGADGSGGGGFDGGDDGDGENVGWYVQREETTEGPVPEKQLQKWYRLGFIKDDSMVWFEGIEGGAWASVIDTCSWAVQWERVTDPATGDDYYVSEKGVTTWEKPMYGFIRSAVQ